jgi:FKBP-type peptidyl-prolyl cis-trans isomerase
MKKLILLISLILVTLTSFSQTVTNQTQTDTIVALKIPTAKLIIKDLIKGDGALIELEETKKVLSLTNQKIVLKDEIIFTLNSKITNLDYIITQKDEQFKLEAEKLKKQAALQAEIKKPYIEMINNAKATGTKTASGLIYKITQKGSGKKPAVGTTANINYAGYFEDGTLFDSNIKSIEEVFGKYNPQKDQQNGYAPIPFQMGTKEGMIPGFIEGIEILSIGEKGVFVIPPDLGYGPNGYGGVIPPNATLIFELEIVK